MDIHHRQPPSWILLFRSPSWGFLFRSSPWKLLGGLSKLFFFCYHFSFRGRQLVGLVPLTCKPERVWKGLQQHAAISLPGGHLSGNLGSTLLIAIRKMNGTLWGIPKSAGDHCLIITSFQLNKTCVDREGLSVWIPVNWLEFCRQT